MISPWPFMLALLVPLSAAAGIALGGPWVAACPVLVFVLVPLAEIPLGISRTNPDASAEKALASRRAFGAVTWASAPLLTALVLWALVSLARHPRSLMETVFLAFAVGIATGAVGITAAHELVHRQGSVERFLGHWILVLVLYDHWAVEHVHGHHRWVATPGDPASARKGEGAWTFVVRSAVGGLAVRLERRGLVRTGPANRVLRGLAAEALLLMLVAWLLGLRALLFFLGQALVAVILLELVNYVEHYGLRRAPRPGGGWERVEPRHSWNASHRLTNWLLLHLQRHSDHHAHASRRYQILRHAEEAPQLPAGYATMILAAMVPPLWRRIMDPRLESWMGSAAAPRALAGAEA